MNYLDELKKTKKKIWIKTIFVYIIISLLFFLPCLYQDSLSNNMIIYLIIGIFIVCLPGYLISKSICKRDIEYYKKIYAKNITLEILKDNFGEVKYNPTDDLLPKDFAKVIDNAKIPTINSYNNDDYISAKYKNIRIEYADVRMGYIPRNSDMNEHTNFKGKWLILSFNENFKSNIQIGPKIFNGKKTKQMLKGKEYKEIQMTDLDLADKLIIYADHEEFVFNILKSSIIDIIKRLYKETNGKILVFFLNNQIHIGIGDKKNFFEPSIYSKFNLEKEKSKISNQINIIMKLIDCWI